MAIGTLHTFVEVNPLLVGLRSSDLVPVTFFFVPVAYAAIVFGFAGSIGTALLATIVTVPNLVLLHHGVALVGEVSQLLIVNAAAVFLGYWVGREKTARQRARAYAAHVVNAQEEERQRIARDLHDDSVQTMILLCRQLDAVRDSPSLSTTARQLVQEARLAAERATSGLREFARGLRPSILDDLGMVAAIRRLLIDLLDRTHADGNLTIEGVERRLSRDLELGLFRIAQEALSNVERHAAASKVNVTVAFASDEVGLYVADNGAGFVKAMQPGGAATGGLGIAGMEERAELLGGEVDIRSSPGGGTRVRALIPIRTPESSHSRADDR